jgi:hypothetical protein
MTTVPVISDHMIDKFRRTGKRRASRSTGRNAPRASGGSRVVPQSQECMIKGVGAPCGCNPATGICLGTCNDLHQCAPN